ncbi:helix-turn-helix domain-containing protein [Actinoplanes sp. NPDC049265]|uniref:helix-turn-helix domain-containing protein n=1 Tax=Actinoplanes sp. NPDC049265 TaxID=3363902 RepID=UPI0037139E1D
MSPAQTPVRKRLTGSERDKERNRVANLYRRDHNVASIATTIGRNPWVVRTLLAEAGIKLRTFNGPRQPQIRLTPDELRALSVVVVGAYQRGDTIREISRNTRRSYGSTRQLLADAGVTLRRRGGPRKRKPTRPTPGTATTTSKGSRS